MNNTTLSNHDRHRQRVLLGTIVGTCLLGHTCPALASYQDGFAAGLIGVPLMTIAITMYGFLAVFHRWSRAIYAVPVVLFVPLAIYGLMLAGDAVMAIKGSRDAWPYHAYLYLALYGSMIATFIWMVKRLTRRRATIKLEAKQTSDAALSDKSS